MKLSLKKNLFSSYIACLKNMILATAKKNRIINHTQQSLDPLNCSIRISHYLHVFILTIHLRIWANDLCFKNEELSGKKLRL